ncbi:MAG: hypothetical protein AAFO07_20500, partial [Bacteroidota bacterium]
MESNNYEHLCVPQEEIIRATLRKKSRVQCMKLVSKQNLQDLKGFEDFSFFNCLRKIEKFRLIVWKIDVAFMQKQLATVFQEADYCFENTTTETIENILKRLLLIDTIFRKIGKSAANKNHKLLSKNVIAFNLSREELQAFIIEHAKTTKRDWLELLTNLFNTYYLHQFLKLKKRTTDNTSALNRKLKNQTLKFLRKKLVKPSVRSSFTNWSYNYLISKHEIEGFPYHRDFNNHLPLIAESVISCMYLHNKIFDRKDETTDLHKQLEEFLKGSLLKERIYNYIYRYINEDIQDDVAKLVIEMFTGVDFGQFLDKEYNNFETYQKYGRAILDGKELKVNKLLDQIFSPHNIKHTARTKRSLEQIIDQNYMGYQEIESKIQILGEKISKKSRIYLDVYFRRIYLTSGLMFIKLADFISKNVALQAALQQKSIDKTAIQSFAIHYGCMLQIVNDNTDFVLTDFASMGKCTKDICADLLNGTISLPILFHLILAKDRTIEKILYSGVKLSKEELYKTIE